MRVDDRIDHDPAGSCLHREQLFSSYDDVFSNKNTAVMCTPYVSESDSDEPTVPVLKKGMPMVVSVVCSSPLSS